MLRCPAPVVASPDDVDRLLGQLTLIGSIERDLTAELERQTQELKDRLKAEQLVEVGTETPTFKEFRDKAVAAIVAYAESPEGRAELIGDEKQGKTRHFTHGSVSYRKLPAKLVDIDKRPATTKAKLLGAIKGLGKDGVGGAIGRWLSQFKVNQTKTVGAEQLYSVKVEPDRRAILKLALDKQLTPAWLKRFNLAVEVGDEVIDVDPAEELVRSETTTRAA